MMSIPEQSELNQSMQLGDEISEDPLDAIPLAHNLDGEKKRTTDVQLNLTESDERPVTSTTQLSGSVRFADLQISPPILRGLNNAGFSRPSPVQIKAIPLGRMGLDLIVQAKSGTGKTVVFAVVLLEAIDIRRPVVQALVLAPTREIALQSQNVIERLGVHVPGLKCRLFVGGLPLADNLKDLQGCQIAVGTPGRVRYLIETGYLSTEHIRHLVLDEADLLLAGGAEAKLTGGSANNAFPADINYIWWSLPNEKQMMALSATYTDYLVEEHLQRYMNDPVLIRLAAHDPALLGVRQFFVMVEPSNRSPAAVFAAKISYLCKLLSSVDFQQCLIFSNFHNSAQELCDALHSRGWPVGYISSNLDQCERFRAFNRLRAFHCRVLVSTDLTSRGIDAENVNLVVSLEVPWEHEIYLHRVGRAGRFGSYGASVLIVTDVGDELNLLRRLQSRCPTKIRKLPEPTPADLAAPDCPVDLNSLVTVTSCTKQAEKRLKPPARPPVPQPAATSEPTVASTQSDAPQSRMQSLNHPVTQTQATVSQLSTATPSKPKQTVPSWSQLPQELNTYLDQAVQNSCKFGEKKSNADTSISIDALEQRLLNSLEQYCAAGMPPIRTQDLTVESDKEQPAVGRKFPPPLKEPPKHVTTVSTDETPEHKELVSPLADKDPPSNPWTPRQIAAWYEYHNLVNQAYWYRSSWELAMNEYRSMLQRWNALSMSAD